MTNKKGVGKPLGLANQIKRIGVRVPRSNGCKNKLGEDDNILAERKHST